DVYDVRPGIPYIGFGGVSGGGAAGEQLPLQLQGAEAFGASLSTGIIDDHIEAAAAANPRLAVHPVNLSHIILRRGIDGVIGAKLLQPRELPIGAGAGDHFAADRLGQLHAAGAHAAAGAEDQDLVTALKLATGFDH